MSREPHHARSTPLGSAPRVIKLPAFIAIITTAALFGIAAETALAHFGLDIPSAWTAWRQPSTSVVQFALSWWSLWASGWAAFFIGKRGAEWAATRLKLRLKVGTGVLAFLLFAAVGHLKPAPSELGLGTTMLLRGVAPLATVALALWGFGAARRRPGESWWSALHEPFETPIVTRWTAPLLRPHAERANQRSKQEPEQANLSIANEVLEQLPHVSFRTLGL